MSPLVYRGEKIIFTSCILGVLRFLSSVTVGKTVNYGKSQSSTSYKFLQKLTAPLSNLVIQVSLPRVGELKRRSSGDVSKYYLRLIRNFNRTDGNISESTKSTNLKFGTLIDT